MINSMDIMKTNVFLFALVLGGFIFQSCDDDDNNAHFVNEEAKAAFNVMYPDASRVEWEKEGDYYVVDFYNDNKSKEAWYNNGGEWFLTETDIRFEELPLPIQTAFNTSEYSSWQKEDVDMIERPEMETLYVIEVEKGQEEYDLYYSADGMLIKAVPDSDNSNGNYLPQVIPDAIKEYIATNYPQAKIIETDFENGRYEVDIIEGAKHKELIFDPEGEWISTETEVGKAEIPSVVISALEASEYGAYRIDDIDYFETPSGNYYLFELESGSREVHLKINLQGVIIK